MSSPQADRFMDRALFRILRMHCSVPDAKPALHRDGVLAVAAIHESAGLARLLLVDMGLWDRNDGASVTNAVDVLGREAHRRLISGFGFRLDDLYVVEQDASGAFDLVEGLGRNSRASHRPLRPLDKSLEPRTAAAFLSWTGEMGREMLRRVEAVGRREWAGVEG
jgi:hypothetical protein